MKPTSLIEYEPGQMADLQPDGRGFELDRAEIESQARELIANRETYSTPEVKRPERIDNARTAIMEALTASGHLSRVELHGETLDEIHQQVMGRLLKGYNDDLPNHEKWRRFYEICEELTIYQTHKAIDRGLLPDTTAVGVVSDYPKIEEKLANRLGYRSENQKGMTRSTHFLRNSDGSYTRIIEQVSRSNSGAESTYRLLQDFGHTPEQHEGPDDHVALKLSFTYDTKELADGVIDLQRKLDFYASSGAVRLRYGEKSSAQQLGYEELAEGSKEREAQVDFYVKRLADYEEKLDARVAEGSLSEEQRDGHYKEEVLGILRAICTLDGDYARDCFGEKSAMHYEQAGYFELMGNIGMRDAHLKKAMAAEKPVIYCGVMISSEKAKELGIENSETGDLISEGKEKWGYKSGYCRVQSCEYKGKKTQVGPCSVCKKCEKLFDKGVLK